MQPTPVQDIDIQRRNHQRGSFSASLSTVRITLGALLCCAIVTAPPASAGDAPQTPTNSSEQQQAQDPVISAATATADDTEVAPLPEQTGSTSLPEQSVTADVADEAGTTTSSEPQPTASVSGTPASGESQAPAGESIEGMLNEVEDDLQEMQQMIAAGEYALPEAWLNARVKKIRKTSHRYDPALVQPLMLLGDIAAQQGNSAQALDDYGLALHIQRVSHGLVSAGQVEIVHREADVYRQLGDLKNANEREEYAYHVLKRAYQPYDKSQLPGVYRLAQWYTQTHNIYAARALYQHCFDILSANGLGDTPEALPALEGLVNTYRLERFPPVYLTSETALSYGTGMGNSQFDAPVVVGYLPQGELALQQIVQIRRNNGNDPMQVAEAVLNLADWYLLFDKDRRALPLYDYAYDLLDADESVDAVAYFAEPKLLHYPAPTDPQPPGLGTTREPQIGYVELQFDITDDGFVRSLKTLDSQPDGMMDFRVRKSMRASRYRPPLVEGVPVKTEGQTYRHEFTYYPTTTGTAQATAGTESVQ